MRNAFSFLTFSFILLAGISATAQITQENNVGIGTMNPNPKALLDLTATDRGFMVPRMNSTDRTAIAPGATERSLMVFDTNDSLFYFWNGARWKYFPAKPGDYGWIVSGTNVYSAVSGNVGIGVSSPTAKLHTQGSLRFALLADSTLTKVLTVDVFGNVRTRTLDNDLWDGDSVEDDDADSTNECNISMFYNTPTQELIIQDDCGTISTVIPTDPNDNDKDPTNELQDLSSSSTPDNSQVTIDISGGTGATFINNDADANPTNELQTLTVTRNNNNVILNLSNGGAIDTFSVDDNDWSGAGTGNMYPTTITDRVGVGTATPAHRFDVLGDARVSGRQYFSSTDYYIQNSSLDLLLFSDDNVKFQTTNNHYLVTFSKNGVEGMANFNLNGQDVLTMRGTGSYSVGIGTTTPSDKLQVAGNVRVGLINAPGFTNGGNNYGEQIYFSGGPGFSGGVNSDNDDLLYIARYNNASDESELRISVGDDHNSSGTNLDRLSIGSITSGGGINSFTGLFDFEIENPGSFNGPMLSIGPNGTGHVKGYNGGLSITKPLGSNGQYINLARGTSSTVWSIGYQYGTNRFAIHEGNTNDAAFALTPHFTIMTTTGYVGLGVASPSNRLELPNDNGPGGTGKAYLWDTYSDGRFKKNRTDIGAVLAKVNQLQPLYYQWEKYGHDSKGKLNPTGQISDKKDLGFIAQDVHKLFPEVVTKPANESTEAWSMDYARLTVILTRAIQEQQLMLDAEQDAHQQTKAELENLKDEVEQLRIDVNKISTLVGKKMEATVKAPNN